MQKIFQRKIKRSLHVLLQMKKIEKKNKYCGLKVSENGNVGIYGIEIKWYVAIVQSPRVK